MVCHLQSISTICQCSLSILGMFFLFLLIRRVILHCPQLHNSLHLANFWFMLHIKVFFFFYLYTFQLNMTHLYRWFYHPNMDTFCRVVALLLGITLCCCKIVDYHFLSDACCWEINYFQYLESRVHGSGMIAPTVPTVLYNRVLGTHCATICCLYICAATYFPLKATLLRENIPQSGTRWNVQYLKICSILFKFLFAH